MTEILDGRRVAKEIEADLHQRAQLLRDRGNPPGLAVVLFGDDAPSRVYGRMLQNGCRRVGIEFRLSELPDSVTQEHAQRHIDELNTDASVHGIIIKRPLPGQLADESILQATLPHKDVDGYHFQNVGKLVVGGAHAAPVPCTPAGVLELMRRTGHSPAGKHVVVLGRSATVGKPLSNLLAQKDENADATVTICHRSTADIASHTRHADIIVAAAGAPRFLTRDMVADNAVVIDVGTNVIDDPASEKGYQLVGDADFEGLLGHCKAITPVPGGVGPVTVAMLLKNVLDAAAAAHARGSR